jgi:hypothetical protein
MKTNPASESAVFNPRAFLAFTLCCVGVSLAMVSMADAPPAGVLTPANPVIDYDAGPFFVANQSPLGLGQLDSGPRCDGTTFPCDNHNLTVTLPAGYLTQHKFAGVKVSMSWADNGQNDYDLYIFKNPRPDCSPNDCTNTDGSQQADYQSASGSDPEVATIYPLHDGTQKFTIRINPFQPTGETVHVHIELLPGSGSAVSGFGGKDTTRPGVPRYQNFYAPLGTSAANASSGEFNIGFNPHTGRIMVMNAGPVWRITPPEVQRPAKPECCEGLWEDKSAASTNIGLDPILWTDQKSGRTFVSNSTVGANGVYAYTDNDGDTYVEGSAAPPNGGADHETIGSGPYPATLSALATPANQGEAVYYCSQDIVGPASCQRSDTLGASYGPGVLAYNGQGSGTPGGTDCGGLHGHIHVAPDGTAWLPVNQCGGVQGGAISTDGGTTWTEFKVTGSKSQQQGADPSIAIDSDGTAYYSYVNDEPVAPGGTPEGHAHVKVSKDHGKTWINDFDLGKTHGIRNAVEIEAVGGSSGRAAVGFIGTDVPGPYQDDDFTGVWYAYISTTYDGGKTWVTVNATPNDPVQSHTGVWQQGGGRADRNLLDFNEITVDKKGRVLYGYSDGCVTPECIAGTAPNDYTAYMRVARQSGGKTIFASNDANTDTTTAILAKPPCLSGTRDVVGSHLTWKAPDNGGSEITNYFIYRGTTAGGEDFLTPLGETRGPKTAFTDSSADPNVKDYFYVVKAINSLGLGAASNEIHLKVTKIIVPPGSYSCSGTNVVTDAAGDSRNPAGGVGSTDQADITAISFSVDAAKKTLTTKMNVKNLSLTPSPGTSQTIYYVAWTAPNGKTYATEVDEPDPSGSMSYSYGEFDPSNNQMVSGTTHTTTGTFNQGANGSVTVDVPLSAIGNPTIPISNPNGNAAVTNPFGVTIAGEGALGGGLVFTAPIDRAPDTGGGQAWAVCLPPNGAPTAALTATPAHGTSPLTVTFSGAGSSDPDAGDHVASYTFDFGDASQPVTQAGATIKHTYTTAGEYRARLLVKDTHGLASTNVALAPVEVNAVLRNISTRAMVKTGEDVLIGGFIVRGNQARNILLRAIAPSLQFNNQPVPGTMKDPVLVLRAADGGIIATNDNWKVNDQTHQSQQARIEGTGLAPSNDKESAIVRMLNPGRYTITLHGKSNTTGIAAVEAYDLDPFADSKLANLSSRGLVETGDNAMIGGFVAGPENAAPVTVLIRGIGPSLANDGVTHPLQDPTLELVNADGTTIGRNDNWRDSQEAEIQASGVAPTNDLEAAMERELSPGSYTAILRGKNGGVGVGLVEVYNLH